MLGSKTVPALLVLLSNLAIVAGAAAFGWSPTTVVVLFALDAFLGAVRISVERLFAGRPRGDADVPTYPIAWSTGTIQVAIYEGLLDKRGSIRVADRLPAVHPRNLPDALHAWVFVAAAGFAVGVTWVALEPSGGGPDASLVPVALLAVARHVSVVAGWAARDRYEEASAPTVRRPRDLLLSFAVVLVAVVIAGLLPEDGTVLTVATVPLVLKLPFDFREAGIGPRPLTFDPRSDVTERPVPLPDGDPRYAFENDGRSVYSTAGFWALVHTAFVPGIAIIAVSGILALLYGSLPIVVGGVVLAAGLAFSGDFLAMWLAHATVEYRVHDGAVVAYDRYLDEPQWSVPLEDATSVTTESKPLELRVLPYAVETVVIDPPTGETRRLAYLARPEEFARTLRERAIGRSTTA